MIVLDTSVIVKIIHNKVNLSKLREKVAESEVFGISSISLYEIYFGLYQLKYNKEIKLNEEKWDKELKVIRSIEENLEILHFNPKSAEISAELFNLLRYQGKMIELFDCMIAGNMKAYQVTQIITTNIKHFEKIPDLEIIEF